MGASFTDRAHAGAVLAPVVAAWCSDNGWNAPLVYGIARGGVVVADPVARALDTPTHAVAVRKLGAVGAPEYAIGAIAAGMRVIDATALRISGTTPEQLDFIEAMERAELRRRENAYARAVSSITERDVIVVDDGIATGSTALAACGRLHHEGAARILLAVPVAPANWRPEGDAVHAHLSLASPARFRAVGEFYERFPPVEDDEVLAILDGNG